VEIGTMVVATTIEAEKRKATAIRKTLGMVFFVLRAVVEFGMSPPLADRRPAVILPARAKHGQRSPGAPTLV